MQTVGTKKFYNFISGDNYTEQRNYTTYQTQTTKGGNVVITVSRNEKRLPTYGFDPLGSNSHMDVLKILLTTYGIWVLPKTLSTVFPEIIRIEDI